MKPQQHKQAVMQAFMRCRRDYGQSDNGVADFEKELDSLLAHYQACIAHNDMLLARLRMQEQQMEAIGAGGVSGQRITDDGALQALQACETAYHRMIVGGTPQDCRAHDAARVAFWRVFGGQS